MKQQATGLNADQIRNLAIYLTGKNPGPPLKADLERNMCAGGIRPLDLKAPQWNGWSLDLDNSRFQPNPGIKPEDIPRLKLKFAWAHPGPMATGQPVVIGDWMFLTIEAE
jgi:polyvinyl alcohol dehydrogenase (cytochrome)